MPLYISKENNLKVDSTDVLKKYCVGDISWVHERVSYEDNTKPFTDQNDIDFVDGKIFAKIKNY